MSAEAPQNPSGSADPGAERRAWSIAALWAAGIFAFVPLARTFQEWMREHVGEASFGYLAITCIVLAAAYAARGALGREHSRAGLLWLVGVTAVFVGYTVLLWDNSEEAMHFVQYGVLSLLIYRAASHRLQDASVFLVAALLGTLVGQFEECIQWLVPRRYYGLRDVWIDFVACSLAQLGLAMGWRPAAIRRRFEGRGLRAACLAGACNLFVLWLCTLNTPQRVERYANVVPGLGFLADNASTMFEYGYRYEAPDYVFRSRLSPQELAAEDRGDALRNGTVLASNTDVHYAEFLREHSPARAPFLHEMRVRLFRRDRMLRLASGARGKPDQAVHYEALVTQGYREQRILEEHFYETLKAAGKDLPPALRQELVDNQDVEAPYDSPVSRALITRVTHWQLSGGLFAATLALLFVSRRVGAAS